MWAQKFNSTQYYTYSQSWAVFKYIYCVYALYLNTFIHMYLIALFKYFSNVFKYMYLNTFLNTSLHIPLNINNRRSVVQSSNPEFKPFNAVTYCICSLSINSLLSPTCSLQHVLIFIQECPNKFTNRMWRHHLHEHDLDIRPGWWRHFLSVKLLRYSCV